MNKKTIQLTTEQAQELYIQNPYFRSTILSEFTDEELGIEKVIKDWVELDFIDGWYVSDGSRIVALKKVSTCAGHKNIFATEKQAKSALAMAQLSQLMKDLGDECDVSRTTNKYHYVIYREADRLNASASYSTFWFLAFKTASVRDKFMEKHEQLIKEYFML